MQNQKNKKSVFDQRKDTDTMPVVPDSYDIKDEVLNVQKSHNNVPINNNLPVENSGVNRGYIYTEEPDGPMELRSIELGDDDIIENKSHDIEYKNNFPVSPAVNDNADILSVNRHHVKKNKKKAFIDHCGCSVVIGTELCSIACDPKEIIDSDGQIVFVIDASANIHFELNNNVRAIIEMKAPDGKNMSISVIYRGTNFKYGDLNFIVFDKIG